MNKKVTSNEQKVMNNKQKAMCKYEKVTSNEQRAKSSASYENNCFSYIFISDAYMPSIFF